MKREDEKTLYVGFDESNHGKFPEIIVAVSSLIYSDISTKRMRGRDRMSKDEFFRFLKNPQRSYNHTIVNEGRLDHGKNPLIEAAPKLLNTLIQEQRYQGISSIDLIFDGEIRTNETGGLFKSIHLYLSPEISVSYVCYPKSKKVAYAYPKILVAADSVAHFLFREYSFMEKIGAEKRRVEF